MKLKFIIYYQPIDTSHHLYDHSTIVLITKRFVIHSYTHISKGKKIINYT